MLIGGGEHFNPRDRKRIKIQLISPTEIMIDAHQEYRYKDSEFFNIVRTRGYYDKNRHGWIMPKACYEDCYEKLKNFVRFQDAAREQNFVLDRIPDQVNEYLKPMGEEMVLKIQIGEDGINKRFKTITLKYPSVEEITYTLDKIPRAFLERLYNFQKEGIEFGISKHGRVLIGDEMGVGKTIQALGLCAVYRDQWPILVICPASLKFNWQSETKEWLHGLVNERQILVVKKGGDPIDTKKYKMVIISYDLAKRIWSKMLSLNFQVIVCDEAHYMKNPTSQRCDKILPILRQAKRVIVLTGTPALAKPRELFPLLTAVRPDIYPEFINYGRRYCLPMTNKFTNKMEYEGADNLEELNFVIKNVMIRRLKKDVLSELPSKTRQMVEIETDGSQVSQINDLMEKLRKETGGNLDSILDILSNQAARLGGSSAGDFLKPSDEEQQKNLQQQKSAINLASRCFELTAQAKMKGVIEFLNDLDHYDQKVVVFAHHKNMIMELEEWAQKIQKDFIRIDGRVESMMRGQLVKKFQENPNCKYAFLGITAASIGLTLTASNIVVFAELHWTPANLIQAEDRCHRITQHNNVICYYLVGKNTLDSYMFKALKRKFQTTGKILDGTNAQSLSIKRNSSNMERILGLVEEAHGIINKGELNRDERKELDALINEMEAEGGRLPMTGELQLELPEPMAHGSDRPLSGRPHFGRGGELLDPETNYTYSDTPERDRETFEGGSIERANLASRIRDARNHAESSEEEEIDHHEVQEFQRRIESNLEPKPTKLTNPLVSKLLDSRKTKTDNKNAVLEQSMDFLSKSNISKGFEYEESTKDSASFSEQRPRKQTSNWDDLASFAFQDPDSIGEAELIQTDGQELLNRLKQKIAENEQKRNLVENNEISVIDDELSDIDIPKVTEFPEEYTIKDAPPNPEEEKEILLHYRPNFEFDFQGSSSGGHHQNNSLHNANFLDYFKHQNRPRGVVLNHRVKDAGPSLLNPLAALATGSGENQLSVRIDPVWTANPQPSSLRSSLCLPNMISSQNEIQHAKDKQNSQIVEETTEEKQALKLGEGLKGKQVKMDLFFGKFAGKADAWGAKKQAEGAEPDQREFLRFPHESSEERLPYLETLDCFAPMEDQTPVDADGQYLGKRGNLKSTADAAESKGVNAFSLIMGKKPKRIFEAGGNQPKQSDSLHSLLSKFLPRKPLAENSTILNETNEELISNAEPPSEFAQSQIVETSAVENSSICLQEDFPEQQVVVEAIKTVELTQNADNKEIAELDELLAGLEETIQTAAVIEAPKETNTQIEDCKKPELQDCSTTASIGKAIAPDAGPNGGNNENSKADANPRKSTFVIPFAGTSSAPKKSEPSPVAYMGFGSRKKQQQIAAKKKEPAAKPTKINPIEDKKLPQDTQAKSAVPIGPREPGEEISLYPQYTINK